MHPLKHSSRGFIRSRGSRGWGSPPIKTNNWSESTSTSSPAIFGHAYAPWGDSLLVAETRIEQIIFDHRRLGEQAEIQRAITKQGGNASLNAIHEGLLDQYPGYYGDTCSYAHELIEPPDRLLLGAANEIMVADVDPDLTFFQSLMPWLRAGHWPCGWEGRWPEGKLILW